MKHGNRDVWIWAGLLIALLAGARQCAALPVAGAYPSEQTALSEPNEQERKILRIIQADRTKRGAQPIKWDGLVSAVAREHSENMAERHQFDYAPPHLGTIEYRLHRAGVSAPSARYAVYYVSSASRLLTELNRKGDPFHMQTTAHLGVGVVFKGFPPRLYVTLIMRQKFSTLERFPTMPLLGEAYRLAGTINEGFSDPTLLVTLPSGKVVEEPLKLQAERKFETIVHFDKGPGKYTVELVARGQLGPVMLDLMHCYAGVSYPPPRGVEKTATPKDLRQAEQLMFEIINRTRVEEGLPPLRYDRRLAVVARSHSQDMMQNEFFAHVSPDRGDLSRRLDLAEIKAKRFSENIADNRDIGAAHRGLMDSPAHRRNILDPGLHRVGIGIVKADDGQLFITQDFAEDFTIYDTQRLAVQFRSAVQRSRARQGRRPLRHSERLSGIALQNSKWMMEQNKLGNGKAKTLMDRARFSFSYMHTALFKSVDSPTPEQIAETLKAKYHEIGVGIVQTELRDGEKYLWTTVFLTIR